MVVSFWNLLRLKDGQVPELFRLTEVIWKHLFWIREGSPENFIQIHSHALNEAQQRGTGLARLFGYFGAGFRAVGAKKPRSYVKRLPAKYFRNNFARLKREQSIAVVVDASRHH
jgi:hypothetical protein